MFHTDDVAIDHFKDVPGFKGLLKAVLKHQIQILVEQLWKHADEETIVMSASVSDGGLSCQGSVAAKGFLEEKEEIKVMFLRHCLTKRHMQESASPMTSYADTHPSQQFDQPQHPVYSHNVDAETYHRDHQPRNKARKLSHPHHIKPSKHLQDSYNQEHGIDLSNHAKRKPRQALVETRLPSIERNHQTSRSSTRTHSNPLITIIKTEPTTDSDSKLEQSSESEPEFRITQVEPSGNSDEMPADLTKDHLNSVSDTGQQNLASAIFQQGLGMDSDGLTAQMVESWQAVSQAAEQSQPALGILDSSQLIPWGNQTGNKTFGYGPQPQKKRVYRKVECDICHKLIYITNIKVHKLRHMKNSFRLPSGERDHVTSQTHRRTHSNSMTTIIKTEPVTDSDAKLDQRSESETE